MNRIKLIFNRKISYVLLVGILIMNSNCMNKSEKPLLTKQDKEHKSVVYQVFTRLFGNTNSTNKTLGDHRRKWRWEVQ